MKPSVVYGWSNLRLKYTVPRIRFLNVTKRRCIQITTVFKGFNVA